MWSKLYAIDIETDTSPITPAERTAGFTLRGLDPRITPIVNIAIASPEGVAVFRGSERRMLQDLEEWLRQAPAGALVSWNGSAFDLPFIFDRAGRLGVTLGLNLEVDVSLPVKYEALSGWEGGCVATWGRGVGRPAHTHLDISYLYQRACRDSDVPWALKPTARALGIEVIEVDRARIHLLSPGEQDRYVASDALATLTLARHALSGNSIIFGHQDFSKP